MKSSPLIELTAEELEADLSRRPKRHRIAYFFNQLWHHKLPLAGLLLVIAIVLVNVFAPWLAPFDPTTQDQPRLSRPTQDNLMGTDALQRDVFSRVLFGGRIPLIVGIVSVLFALTVGVLLGWVSGFTGGIFDRSLALIMDAIYSFPGLILAIAVSAILGRGVLPMTIAISVVYVPTYFRVVRGQVFQIKEQEYVEAARALGSPWLRILLRHIAPNTMSSILAVAPINVADAILTEAGLAFLGLGLAPPTPDWGFDISNGQQYLLAGDWWLVTFPGIMIILVSLGFGMMGEGLSDWLNPKRRRG
ncbi:ABC transporter permease [Candidatus Acetothermia bacterium]|nr:ABC transporter permease [Candidatus Acetothermia bacterium]